MHKEKISQSHFTCVLMTEISLDNFHYAYAYGAMQV